jgi:hypothetical protein
MKQWKREIRRTGSRGRGASSKEDTAEVRGKVRSPQGSVPANGRGGALKARFTESATENIPPAAATPRVRVKRCGKSAPRSGQPEWQGKPHAEQDQIGEDGVARSA